MKVRRNGSRTARTVAKLEWPENSQPTTRLMRQPTFVESVGLRLTLKKSEKLKKWVTNLWITKPTSDSAGFDSLRGHADKP